MLHHQKAADGNGKLERGLARHFAVPEGDFDRWHYLTQLNQVRAVAAGVEHWRSHWPVCAGTVVWQLNDCWPVTSWSAIDGDGREKPLYHELRRLYADRLLTVRTDGDGDTSAGRDGGRRLVVAAVNQAAEQWRTVLRLRRMAVDGRVLAEAEPECAAGARTVALVEVPAELVPAGPEEFLVADAQDPAGSEPLRALHFPAADRDIPYPRPEFEVALAPEGVTVTARTLVRDLLLQADRLDPEASADRGPVTLLPGERVTIGVRGRWTPDLKTARAALYCVEPAR